MVLWKVAEHDDVIAKSIVELGAIDVLLELLRKGSEDAKARAEGALLAMKAHWAMHTNEISKELGGTVTGYLN